MTVALKDLTTMKDYLRTSNGRPESGERITFYAIIVKNGQMWHF